MNRRNVFFMLGGIAFLLVLAQNAALAAPLIPSVNVDVGSSNKPQDVAVTLQVMALLTILSLAPGVLIMTTSFVRIVVVIGFLRNALSTQNVPPNQVVIALSLFLTFYIMSPYWSQANENGIQPYMAGQITQEEALKNVVEPIREFMFKQTRESDLALFVNLADDERRQPAGGGRDLHLRVSKGHSEGGLQLRHGCEPVPEPDLPSVRYRDQRHIAQGHGNVPVVRRAGV